MNVAICEVPSAARRSASAVRLSEASGCTDLSAAFTSDETASGLLLAEAKALVAARRMKSCWRLMRPKSEDWSSFHLPLISCEKWRERT